MRCDPAPPVSLKLNFPLLSALVLAAISMEVVRLMRMTSSPAAGLPVVPLVTVPERVWAAAVARESERMAASIKDCAGLVKTTPRYFRDIRRNLRFISEIHFFIDAIRSKISD